MVALNGNGWTLVPCLVKLLDEVNQIAPARKKQSDGTIGDASHQARVSDHNPDKNGNVCALDVTNDPNGGFDSWKIANIIANNILNNKEKRVAYLISWDGNTTQIFSKRLFLGWKWRNYSGPSHQNHLHVSVVHDVSINSSVDSWGLKTVPSVKPEPPVSSKTKEQSMFFAKKSNSNTIWLITPAGKVGMSSPKEFTETQKAIVAAGFNGQVVVFPIAEGIDVGNFIDNIKTIG